MYSAFVRLAGLDFAVVGLEISTLLVEDNLADAEMLSELLESMGDASFIVQRVATLQEAREYLARQDFALIFLSLSLPDSLGLDTLAEIRVHDQHTPVIVLTELDDRETMLFAARMKANAYFVKRNLNPDTLYRSIREAVDPDRKWEDGAAGDDPLELIVARDSHDFGSVDPEFNRERMVHRAVEKERALLAAAVSSADDPSIVTDKNSVILYVNPAFSRVTGLRIERRGPNYLPDILSRCAGSGGGGRGSCHGTRSETWGGWGARSCRRR